MQRSKFVDFCAWGALLSIASWVGFLIAVGTGAITDLTFAKKAYDIAMWCTIGFGVPVFIKDIIDR